MKAKTILIADEGMVLTDGEVMVRQYNLLTVQTWKITTKSHRQNMKKSKRQC